VLALVLAAVPLTWTTFSRRTPDVLERRSVVTVVRFSLDAAGARRVALAGDFNGWKPDEILLADTTGRGHFSVTLPLRPGRYAYMFVVDSATWVTDPRAEAHRDDGFGNLNAVVTIEDAGQDHGKT
jgi:1,4-alpha-glucan branching enzyme